MSLSSLPEKYKSVTLDLLATGATQAVPGWGNPKADIMFIGEAPGATEDKLAKPFVGPAGKFLDELLASIGLKREEVYITNMVKVRPPGNRDPEESELEAYKPWLDEEIEMINPKVFVPLGRFALGKFLPGQGISRVHGQAFDRAGKIYFVMYHPAAALYNGSMRAVMLEDMKGLKRILDGDLTDVQELNEKVNEIKEMMEKSKEKKESEKNEQVGFGI